MASSALIYTAAAIGLTPFLAVLFWNYGLPTFFRFLSRTIGASLGWYLRRKTDGRRALIERLSREQEQEFEKSGSKKPSDSLDDEWEHIDPSTAGTSKSEGNPDWDGIVGFFHPFCNAGGGGERVLWAAIRATQKKWPKAKCVVYTGDHDVTKDKILERVENTFSIHIHPPTVTFLYLSTRRFVLASTWPHFTLAGQSLGSLILGWDAFSLLVPDIFVDTMGYAFVLGLSKMLFPEMPTGAYVHYPTISTDMIESLDPESPLGSRGVNAGQGAGLKGLVKRYYWNIFAAVYCWMGASIDVVMTNSTWTQAHIKKLWGPRRAKRSREHPIVVVYPPCAVRELEREIEISEESEKQREKALLYIAQFRPEKNHSLIVNSFAELVNSGSEASKNTRLVLVGSVRDDSDSKRVYQLRLLVNELGIKDRVTFQLDASWPDILQWLRKAYIGVNGMWNEHFGIGCVEYQAAGLIGVVHNSGGPKLDIFTEVDGEPTGFHATTASEFAQGYDKALSLPNPLSVRKRARVSSMRFTEEEFARRWLAQMNTLVGMKN
ncbi:GDP-Man:Man(3)GlcNAc(2)-PP-Dol alpha-1,2-mannosyltransferase [Pestalotiopsis fici W106-1]|uniref:GDP-Man:Man(3)GlcNAc(2)-PP-Dol alpha-1,2-mannosyltransferase n=1 Tax=Pestalotiopsis fici (strain W106-1 / CGMCC3.15140) TaxID=1229662 RepID=W3XJ11_PESFW|nr:GDP-Man:Man(3)GlcNAc(2)-PP-Dol alpha-1,2-mannosyltransferase [Pestalotiopsis fici W106-1]ETS86005.1 GDP-Man:Man(3)GlcNAc(2)-PP-Dol alpha-1,2-mannosyltransferase [Pestalotiopsis fici W106-1]